jgi:hypothetical protein
LTVVSGSTTRSCPTWRRAEVGRASAKRDAEDLQGFPHGMPTTEAETINADLLAFIKSQKERD